jgi:hypothetical protein
LEEDAKQRKNNANAAKVRQRNECHADFLGFMR